MKRIIGFLFVFVSFILSSTAQTTLTEGVDWNGTAPGVYEKLQLVRIGASYDYEVEKHVTKTLKQILNTLDGNDNRYFWEVVKVTGADESAFTYTGGTFTNLTEANFVAQATATNKLTYKFDGAVKGDYYVIRVSEFANHESENVIATSLTADFKTKTIAEILIKIAGEIEVIIPDPIPGDPILADKNKDVFSCWETGKDFQAEFDQEIANYGKTKVFIGAPLLPTGIEMTLTVTTFKKGALVGSVDKSYTIPSSELTYQADKGSYLYEFGWQDLLTKYAFTLDTDASVDDIYHVISVKSITHRDGDLVLSPEQQDFASRTYGFYHPTKITKIQHNK
ncbi:hypothetical protein E0494_02325 [Marinilabiliaceae bacterium JC040]|nr:hypothetical protein [Marinilabiliaceae bacterium JC040]